MKSTKIDCKPPIRWLGINFNEAFTEPDVAPGVISLRLHRGGNDGVDSNDGGNKCGATFCQRFCSLAVKGALLIDGVAKGKRGGKRNQPVEVQFEMVEVSEIVAFQNWLITGEQNPELGFDHTLRPQVADA